MIRRPVLQITIIGIAVIGLSLLYFFYPATNTSAHPKCPFNQITGLYCPGCGSQRAVSALLHGNLSNAINFNILFVISTPFILYSAFIFIWNTFSNKKFSQQIFYRPLFTRILFIAILAFWILRNIPIAPFNWLAP
jgi:ABC-type Na+ efflux pump permease subunit